MAAGLFIAMVIAVSAVWVYLDASKNRIGKTSAKGFFNLSAGAWGTVTLLLWIVGFPAYLSKRRALLETARTEPRDSPGRALKAVVLALFGLLIVAGQTQPPPKSEIAAAPALAAPPPAAPVPSPAPTPERPTRVAALAAAPPPPAAPRPPAPPPEPITTAQAFAALLPDMGDTVDEVSTGAIQFAIWSSEYLGWNDVYVRKDETSVARVTKDADAERGKRMCVRGQITQIRREQKGIFSGTIMTGGFKFVHFMSAGSTGDLVDGSHARLCGYVTGTYAYSNVSGGQTQSVQMVGMFDLPENRAP